MDKSLMRECFHNCLSVAPREDDYLVPARHTPVQCAFYDHIPYGAIMGEKARMSAGITVEFDTNAPSFTLQWKIVGGYTPDCADRDTSLDVYVNDVLLFQLTHLKEQPWNQPLENTFNLGEGRKRVVIFLPHTLIFALGDILIPEGNYYLAPVPKRTAHVLMIGDSITQGIGAEYCSAGYAMQVSRALGCECLNQSVAAVRFEPEMLDNTGFQPDLITVALGTNDWSNRADSADYDDYAGRFFKRLDQLYPDIPVAVITPVKRVRGEPDLPADRPNLYRESELADAIARLCKPYPQMRIVEGWRLMPHVPGFFLDGLHPNDLGMSWMANGFLQALSDIMR